MDCEILSEVISFLFLYHRKCTKFLSSSFKEICKNSFSMSTIKIMLFAWKRKMTEVNGSVNEDPGYRQSFNVGSSIFELPSNTIHTLDVT